MPALGALRDETKNGSEGDYRMPNPLILTAKSSEEKETGGISGNLSSSIAKGRDQGKPLENVSSKFFVGTEKPRSQGLSCSPQGAVR